MLNQLHLSLDVLGRETSVAEKRSSIAGVVLLLSLFMAVQGQSHHLGSGFLGFLPRLRHVLMRCLTFIRSPRSADAHEQLGKTLGKSNDIGH